MTAATYLAGLTSRATVDENKYLKKKISGGKSSRDGLIFEEWVATFEIINLFEEVKLDNIQIDSVEILLQSRSLIDDIVIFVESIPNWIEAKSGRVSWGDPVRINEDQELKVVLKASVKRKLSDNFKSQIRIDSSAGQPASYCLAIALEDREKALSDQRENLGLQNVKILVLPDKIRIPLIENAQKGFRDKASNLCPLTESDEDLETLLWAIMTALRRLDSGRLERLSTIAADAEKQFKGLLSFQKDLALSTQVHEILTSIEGLAFGVCGSVLHYVYDGDHGRGRFHIGSDSGFAFEEDVLIDRPLTFEELFPLLRKTRC